MVKMIEVIALARLASCLGIRQWLCRLIYEVVWLQQLQLVIGSSAVSLGLLLATYMGGLFLGSIAVPRMISARRDPFRLYGAIELGIGTLGLVILFGLPLVSTIYVSSASQGFLNVLFRGVICTVCLLPPTTLMGTTFPILARSIAPTKVGTSWMGFIYAANIAGAVMGCLCAGFYLLRVHDLAIATYTAIAIKCLYCTSQFSFGRTDQVGAGSPCERTSGYSSSKRNRHIRCHRSIRAFRSRGSDCLDTTALVLFGATVYTFSIILAVFLIGLGIGSGADHLFPVTRNVPGLRWLFARWA